jgi:SEL1 protein
VANQYFAAAASHDNIKAHFLLGRAYQFGIGLPENSAMAVAYYKRAADKGEWREVHDTANELFQEGEVDRSLILYEELAERGYEVAQSNVAYIYDSDLQSDWFLHSSIDRRKKAFRYYRRSAEQLNAQSHLKLGDYYYYGLGGVARDLSKAAAYYRYASDMHNAQATFNIGYMHQWGEGLVQDFYLSKRFYDMALVNNVDAVLPVKLALLGLAGHFVYNYVTTTPPSAWVDLPWDNVLLGVLVVLLVTALLYRQLR